MDYQEFSSTARTERTIEFRSPEELEDSLNSAGVNQRTRHLEKCGFRACLTTVRTDHADLFSSRYNAAISIQFELPENIVGLMIPRSASGHFVAEGEDVSNDRLLVFAGRNAPDISGPAFIGSEAIALPKKRFIEMAEVLCPTADRPEVTASFDGDPVQLHKLRLTVADLVGQAESDVHGEDVANVVAEAIAWMGDSCSRWEPDYLTEYAARTRVAKLVRAYIEEHYAEAVHIEDLCRVTGAGARTVQRSFREYFDLTVRSYLKIARLDSARRQLAAAQQEEATVTEIALDNGCTHLGRFAVEFRDRFGVSPRDVLTKHPGQKH